MITEKLIFKIPYEIPDVPDLATILGANYYEDWDSRLGVNDTAGAVSGWLSQGLNGGLLSASGVARPLLTTSAKLGGVDVIEFDGLSEYMAVAGSTADYNFLHDGSGGTVIMVYEQISTPAIISVSLANTWNSIGFRMGVTSSDLEFSIARNLSSLISFNLVSSAISNNEFNLKYDLYDVGNATLADRLETISNGTSFKNNSTSGTPSSSDAAFDLTIGNEPLGGGATGNVKFKGQFARIVIADSILTPTQITQVQTRLIYDYGGSFPIS